MIALGEQGRRLSITLAAGTEEAEAFIIPPADAEAGAALLAGYVGIMVGLFGDTEQAEEDVVKLSLGLPTPVEPEAGEAAMARYQKRHAAFMDTYSHVNELRSSEIFTIVQIAFLWQVNGGSLEAAQTYVDNIGREDDDALGKALELVARRLGLSDLTEILEHLGPTSTSTASPTPTPASPSTPDGSEPGSRTPAVPPNVRQPTDHLPPQT